MDNAGAWESTARGCLSKMDGAIIERAYAECLNPEVSPFGLWINALYGVVDIPELTLAERKEAFLGLVQKLLDNGKIVLFVPNGVELKARVQGGADFIWDVSHQEMIAFLRRNWPDGDPQDEVLFFYDPARCPGVGWVDPETGEIVAS
nr:hypothetical protein [uncultured Sphingomonas sp.]